MSTCLLGPAGLTSIIDASTSSSTTPQDHLADVDQLSTNGKVVGIVHSTNHHRLLYNQKCCISILEYINLIKRRLIYNAITSIGSHGTFDTPFNNILRLDLMINTTWV
ncbi:hypothetical protein BDA99DRAFT_530967 [Phascolomyces articulosus]|uniref:Uncharacterized protein n=1 Tax=Phascolomyces articulosus TaxID=60185 RepID=A0AAD5KC12_9FUNG|nr:hypothetical protein BDA99DRAFT_530967 [Phascolomyces articulosus]